MAQILTATDMYICTITPPCVLMAPVLGALTSDSGHLITALGNGAI